MNLTIVLSFLFIIVNVNGKVILKPYGHNDIDYETPMNDPRKFKSHENPIFNHPNAINFDSLSKKSYSEEENNRNSHISIEESWNNEAVESIIDEKNKKKIIRVFHNNGNALSNFDSESEWEHENNKSFGAKDLRLEEKKYPKSKKWWIKNKPFDSTYRIEKRSKRQTETSNGDGTKVIEQLAKRTAEVVKNIIKQGTTLWNQIKAQIKQTFDSISKGSGGSSPSASVTEGSLED